MISTSKWNEGVRKVESNERENDFWFGWSDEPIMLRNLWNILVDHKNEMHENVFGGSCDSRRWPIEMKCKCTNFSSFCGFLWRLRALNDQIIKISSIWASVCGKNSDRNRNKKKKNYYSSVFTGRMESSRFFHFVRPYVCQLQQWWDQSLVCVGHCVRVRFCVVCARRKNALGPPHNWPVHTQQSKESARTTNWKVTKITNSLAINTKLNHVCGMRRHSEWQGALDEIFF